MSNRGKLFVVATPIGNLQDISFRAVETLKKVNCIFAEDTRTSKKLINHYDIDTKLYSYHDHSSEKEIARLLDILKDHKDVALISDAGTPTISDPGYSLIRQCINEGIDVIPIPGASALTAAISASGLPSDAFAFIGFLPTKKGRKKKISSLENLDMTIVLFESPHRLIKTLNQLKEALGERPIVVARELTKLYEEIIRGNFSSAIEFFEAKKIKGEIVIMIGKNDDRINF
ncbi:MAG: 16S rRNA (cytidine(1402)-2'-O)-methyltransferase [Candidatus Neomarinimicrobiota bacterium]|tara:strand:- start:27348 stop:28040 length:693 start_codon:yes stop_codon:yes gene_type:complete